MVRWVAGMTGQRAATERQAIVANPRSVLSQIEAVWGDMWCWGWGRWVCVVLLYKLTNCPLGQTGLDEKCYVILTVFVIITWSRKWTTELDLPPRPRTLLPAPALSGELRQTEGPLYQRTTSGSDLDHQTIKEPGEELGVFLLRYWWW